MALAQANVGQRFASADRVLDFTDGMVYTLVATGNGNFGANNGAGSFGDTATVNLVLIQESTAPATFGMASLRFLHAISAASTDSINIQDTNSRNSIVNGLGFGSVSDYMDFTPNTQRNFAIVKSSNTQIPLAPTDALSLGASLDIRAGLRATVICANTDSQNPTVFCRMIPSRAVAYVRLINNNAGNLNYVVGPASAQRLQDVSLTLWANYWYPYPSQVAEQAQNMQTRCARTDGSPLFNRGLYPVVQNVAVNTVSDYGEVHIPLFLMDFAVRPIVRELDCPAGAGLVAGYNGATDDPQDPNNAANQRWFDMAPAFKRGNFIVKTSGFATLTGRSDVNDAPKKRLLDADSRKTLKDALLLNEYMEPGQYYSLLAQPPAVADTTKAAFLQQQGHVSYYWRLDATVASVAAGVDSTVGALRFIALFGQTPTAVSLSGRSATFGPFATTFFADTASTVPPVAPAVVATGKPLWVVPTASEQLTLAPGTYTFSGLQAADTCNNMYPSGSVSVVGGQRVDIFLLGSYSCTSLSTTPTLVQKVPKAATLASSSCVGTSAPTSFLLSAAVHASPTSFLFFSPVSLERRQVTTTLHIFSIFLHLSHDMHKN